MVLLLLAYLWKPLVIFIPLIFSSKIVSQLGFGLPHFTSKYPSKNSYMRPCLPVLVSASRMVSFLFQTTKKLPA